MAQRAREENWGQREGHRGGGRRASALHNGFEFSVQRQRVVGSSGESQATEGWGPWGGQTGGVAGTDGAEERGPTRESGQ